MVSQRKIISHFSFSFVPNSVYFRGLGALFYSRRLDFLNLNTRRFFSIQVFFTSLFIVSTSRGGASGSFLCSSFSDIMINREKISWFLLNYETDWHNSGWFGKT